MFFLITIFVFISAISLNASESKNKVKSTRELVSEALEAKDESVFIGKLIEVEHNQRSRRGSKICKLRYESLSEKGLEFPLPDDALKFDECIVRYTRDVLVADQKLETTVTAFSIPGKGSHLKLYLIPNIPAQTDVQSQQNTAQQIILGRNLISLYSSMSVCLDKGSQLTSLVPGE
ncbi:MAG TPA: hypothetical protein VFF04_06590 [Candidatus Babeliales bacterium]|nr:hypothetical protein [Candidatus Babeliales bacterium]